MSGFHSIVHLLTGFVTPVIIFVDQTTLRGIFSRILFYFLILPFPSFNEIEENGMIPKVSSAVSDFFVQNKVKNCHFNAFISSF